MDFEQLSVLLPKLSNTWTVNDIEMWLRFIGLHNYVQSFTASVDGSCLSILTEQDLRHQLGIQSNIITKKILAWISKGIKQYDQYLLSNSLHLKQSKQNLFKTSLRIQPQSNLEKSLKPSFEQFSQVKIPRQATHEKGQAAKNLEQKKQKCQLIIKQCESNMIYSCYSLKEQGGMIGRNSKNQIHIVDQNISRFHAQVEYDDCRFFIRDYGSSSGTFMRIIQKTPLIQDMIIQMGSNQFCTFFQPDKSLTLKVLEGPNLPQSFNIPLTKPKVNIGRKITNQLNFPEDQHLSNIHATIFLVQGVWYIQDLCTTNGSWLRLSPEGVKSDRWELHNQTQFKLGSNLTYECQINNENRKTEKEKSDKCTLCRKQVRDCIFLPCKHNVCCYHCACENQFKICIVCKSAISDSMKIFKV